MFLGFDSWNPAFESLKNAFSFSDGVSVCNEGLLVFVSEVDGALTAQ